ncbi:MAG: class I tRNA ligase family protein, partial [Candidatus Pacebacteria bacterium]|nr:class I tRNA ligase family protein [Candidatus Paceibacterota bacterium]
IRMPVWYNIDNNPDLQITFIKNNKTVVGKLSELLKKHSLKTIRAGLQSLRAPIKAQYQVSLTPPGDNYLQETDTFDTWFSSSQWPVVTLKNNKARDFKRFYPTAVMETAYDILPFWVMRMLMMGLFMTNQVPFKKVYFHGLIRDAKGQKMSKSKGNVVNPLKITAKYGADALRMALTIRSSAGLDKSVGVPDFKAARNLTNKIWNAARFVLMNQQQQDLVKTKATNDEQFVKKLQQVVAQVSNQLNDYKLGLAAETLYNEFWHWYCDYAIEASKKEQISQQKLLLGLTAFLKLFHPFMPFVTEAIWQELSQQQLVKEPLLITANWPEAAAVKQKTN